MKNILNNTLKNHDTHNTLKNHFKEFRKSFHNHKADIGKYDCEGSRLFLYFSLNLDFLHHKFNDHL
jgi:hypothetical protein